MFYEKYGNLKSCTETTQGIFGKHSRIPNGRICRDNLGKVKLSWLLVFIERFNC